MLKAGPVGQILAGGVSGGLAAEISGGDYIKGFTTGVIVSAFNHWAHEAAEEGGGPPNKMDQIAAEAEAMRSRWDNIRENGLLALDTGNNGMGGLSVGMSQVGGSIRFTNGVYNGSRFSLRHYASGWSGGSVARIKTYKLSVYGSTLGRYSTIGTMGLGVYNMYSGFQMDGGMGYNFQLATTQTIGGWAGAFALGKAGAYLGSYFGPWGTLGGGILGGVIGGFGGTSLSTDMFNHYRKK